MDQYDNSFKLVSRNKKSHMASKIKKEILNKETVVFQVKDIFF